MPDLPITGLAPLNDIPDGDDEFVIVDVSDPTQSPQGTTKKVTKENLLGGILPLRVPVTNASGVSTITKGTLLMAVGTSLTERILAAPAVTDGSVDPIYIIGVAPADLAPGADGYAVSYDEIGSLNTLAYPIGTIWWNDPAVPGGFSTAEPVAPNLKIPFAIVIRQNAGSGRIFVRETVQPRMEDLSDVLVNVPSDRQVLTWDAGAGRWTNADPDAVRTTVSQVGHGFAVGEAIRFDGVNWTRARADNEANSRYVGVVVSVTPNTFDLILQGNIGGLAGLTVGGLYYLSAATPGALTLIAPAGGSTVVKPVLVATSATSGVVINSLTYQSTGVVGTAGGDLGGTYPNPSVIGLQGYPVSSAAPGVDDVLVWDGSQWAPGAAPGGGGVEFPFGETVSCEYEQIYAFFEAPPMADTVTFPGY